MLKKLKYLYYDTIINILLMILLASSVILADELYWSILDKEYKYYLIEEFHNKVTDDLNITDNIELSYYVEYINEDTGRVKQGYYNDRTKNIYINEDLFRASKFNLINTLAHETMHYWQYNVASLGDELYAEEMRSNIKDYSDRKVAPDKDYIEYRTHPIERQARAYAKRFEQRYVISKHSKLTLLSFQLYIITLISVNITKLMYKNLRGIK